jgi:hypothetical protein
MAHREMAYLKWLVSKRVQRGVKALEITSTNTQNGMKPLISITACNLSHSLHCSIFGYLLCNTQNQAATTMAVFMGFT